MFTGLIDDVGVVERIERTEAGRELRVASRYAGLATGESIAVNGACLTVREHGEGWFTVAAIVTTLDRTTIGSWQVGRRVNLERALRLGDELGGHFVTGHVDGLAEVVAVRPEGASSEVEFAAERRLGKFIACKGSITVDGVSLTVNEIEDSWEDGTTHFTVNIIPHTADHTTLGSLASGQFVNIEIDVLARYLQRLEDSRRECD